MFHACGGPLKFKELSEAVATKLVFHAAMMDVMEHTPIVKALAPYAKMRQDQLKAKRLRLYFSDNDLEFSSFEELESHIASGLEAEDEEEEDDEVKVTTKQQLENKNRKRKKSKKNKKNKKNKTASSYQASSHTNNIEDVAIQKAVV